MVAVILRAGGWAGGDDGGTHTVGLVAWRPPGRLMVLAPSEAMRLRLTEDAVEALTHPIPAGDGRTLYPGTESHARRALLELPGAELLEDDLHRLRQ